MLFEIEKNSFFDGLSKTVPITERRSPQPILTHLLIDAAGDQLVMVATDLEVGIRLSYECRVEEPGTLTLPGKKLFEIVRELESGPITVQTVESERVKITSGESAFHLVGTDSSEYPAWSSLDEVKTGPVPADKFLTMIEKTLFASSNDESRFNLNGVLFESVDDVTRLVATDGHRLAMIEDTAGFSFESKVLVPKKGLFELRRILEGLSEEIQVGFEEKNLVIKADRSSMAIRLIDGDYPDYRKVIPEAGDFHVTVNRLHLMQALKRVAVLTSDRNRGVTMEIGAKGLDVSVVHPDLGTARDTVDLEFEGTELKIIVNAAYMIEALGVVAGDRVRLEFIEKGGPIFVRPEPPQNYFNLVMPMRK